jgi:hypothetical protein
VKTRASTPTPQKAPLAATEETGAGLVLYDERSGSTHRLNPLAALIWNLCDGTRSPDTIAIEVAGRFERAPDGVAADVARTLAQFADVGLTRSSPAGGEVPLLLRCVRVAIGTEDPSAEAAQPDAVDWNALVQIALDHGVMPLLYRGLSRDGRYRAPELVLERLRHQYRTNCRVSVYLVRELLDLLALFEREGIRAFPLKGPVLAATLHGHVGARQFGDLDVFVPPADAVRAIDLVRSSGYTLRRSRKTDASAIKAGPQGRVQLDLQWALARKVYRFPIALEDMWDGLRPVFIAGTRVWQPAPDDSIVVLCAHASKHGWSSLVWIADVAASASKHRDEIDWMGLLRRAERRGGRRQLLLGLRLAADLLSVEIPPPLVSHIRRDAAIDSLAEEFRRELFRSVDEPGHRRSFVERGLAYMRSRERLRDRLPYTAMLLKHLVLRAWPQAG